MTGESDPSNVRRRLMRRLPAASVLSRRAALGVAATGGIALLSSSTAQGQCGPTTAPDSGDDARISLSQFIRSSNLAGAAALQAALAQASRTGRTLTIDALIRADRPIAVPGGLSIEGRGTIDLSGGGSLTIGAGVARIADLARDIDTFDTVLQFKAPHGLKVQDVVAVWNPTDFSQAPYRNYYRAGDMFRVAEVLGPTGVRIYGVAREAFAAASVQLYRLGGGFLRIRDVCLIPPTSGTSVLLDGLVDVTLQGIRVPEGATDAALEIHRCYDVSISEPEIAAAAGDAYPIIISNSQKVTVKGAQRLYSSRHCLALGGRDGAATVPTADVLVTHLIAENIASNGVGAADIHGGCKRVTYDGCVLTQATLGGRDVTYRNCRFTGRPKDGGADGVVIAGSEIVGGAFTLENCHLISRGDGIARGAFVDLTIHQRTRPLHLIGRNLTMEHVGPAPSTGTLMSFFIGDGDGSTQPFDLDIRGLKYIGSSAAALLKLSGRQNVARVGRIRVEGYDGPAVRTMSASSPANYDVPLTDAAMALSGLALHGDVDATLYADRQAIAGPLSRQQNIWNAPLSADRTVSFDATRARIGDLFRIVRAATATGGARLQVLTTPPKSLGPAEWCEASFDGERWILTAFRPL